MIFSTMLISPLQFGESVGNQITVQHKSNLFIHSTTSFISFKNHFCKIILRNSKKVRCSFLGINAPIFPEL